ncbi:Cna B-type domain-containing protein [Methanobrevibacter sp.]|uniref:Cna B-type domain-containing protein n=1 Tax=Methanobrevibacter sp. TaxID=66852 RepID=UPI00386375CA
MSLIETYQSCKQLIADNLTEKGVEADATDGLTTLANKILEIEGTSTTKDITVKAEFQDGNNQDGLRPTSLIGKLYADGVIYETSQGPVRVTLNNENSWHCTINNLPINYDYTINFDSIAGYTTSSDVVDNLITYTFTHEAETTNVNANVVFDDNGNSGGQRPESVEVILFKNNIVYKTQTVNEGNGWRCIFNDLPLNNNPTGANGGQSINVYTVNCLSIPEQYKKTVMGSTHDGFNINFEIMEGSLEIRTTLSIEEGIVNEDPTASIGNASFTVLGSDSRMPMSISYSQFSNGKYELDELVPGAYAIICSNAIPLIENAMLASDSIIAMAFNIEDNSSATASLFLHYVPTVHYEEEPEEELINIPVVIVFNDQDNKDLNRPESITVRLYAGGAEVDSAIITADDGWTHTFYELPKYLDGHPINYSIGEDPVEWYSTVINGFTIRNTYQPETTSVSVRKVWSDNNDESGIRPSSIAMTLSNGQVVMLNEANGWTATITGLPTMLNHEAVTYSWTEQSVVGYQLSNQETVGTLTTFTNAPWTRPDTSPGGKTPKSSGDDGWTVFDDYDTPL